MRAAEAERKLVLKPGDKLGNFEIIALLGRGGMGEVASRTLPAARWIRRTAAADCLTAFAARRSPSGSQGLDGQRAGRRNSAEFVGRTPGGSAWTRFSLPIPVLLYSSSHWDRVRAIFSTQYERTWSRSLGHSPLAIEKTRVLPESLCSAMAAAIASCN